MNEHYNPSNAATVGFCRAQGEREFMAQLSETATELKVANAKLSDATQEEVNVRHLIEGLENYINDRLQLGRLIMHDLDHQDLEQTSNQEAKGGFVAGDDKLLQVAKMSQVNG